VFAIKNKNRAILNGRAGFCFGMVFLKSRKQIKASNNKLT